MTGNSPKASARHKSIAKSRVEYLDDFGQRIESANSSLKKYKKEQKQKMKGLDSASKKAMKQEMKIYCEKEKERIFAMKVEYREAIDSYNQDRENMIAQSNPKKRNISMASGIQEKNVPAKQEKKNSKKGKKSE